MQGIFISYRRDDTSAYSRLLYERLAQEFGQNLVFMDVETIREPGTDFVDAINEGVDKCTVLLALIGKNWLSCDSDGTRRLDNPDDFVRIEIASALKRNVLVVPVVVQDANIPVADDLPQELKILARRQALKLSHEDWEYDIGKLIDALAKIPGFERRKVDGDGGSPQPAPVRKGWSTGALAFTALAAVVVVLGGLAMLSMNSDEMNAQAPPPVADNLPAAPETQPREMPVNKPVYAEEVRTAQQSLVALDYDPGVIDGLMGNATVSAIREFQSDEGHLVTGRVDNTLLDQLYAALNDRAKSGVWDLNSTQVASEEPPSQPVATAQPPSQQSFSNLVGTWYDNFGNSYLFEQSGGDIRVSVMNIFTLEYSQIGSGSIAGNVLTLRYSNLGISGTVIATLAADGQHLNGTDTIDGGASVSNSWHYEHLPR